MDTYQRTDVFRPYLLTGERVLWTGQPKQGIALSGRDIFLIPFSLFWGGVVIIWNVIAWVAPFERNGADGAPLWFFPLFGLPFLAVGLYMIFGRFLHDASIRKHIHYAVTDQRVLILREKRSAKITSLDLKRLPRLELSEHRDGTGTLSFDIGDSMFMGRMNGFGAWVPSLSAASQFFRISEPRKVYELIRNQSHS